MLLCAWVFSNNPKLNKLKGRDIYTRYQELRNSEWSRTLDFNSVFNLLYEHAKKYSCAIPDKIIVITDMSFEEAGGECTDFTDIDNKFKSIGYNRPMIVFWNLCTSNGSFDVKFNTNGSILISGFYPSIISAILRGDSPDPVSIMKRTLEQTRYNIVRTSL